ncbi:MAG: type IV pilus biogenesis/stability protein PilW [Gammaproteobacteria bacterium]|nr:type IV pilus biogenesis/stability protein PilW [Gammaproteobacteria bacterium]
MRSGLRWLAVGLALILAAGCSTTKPSKPKWKPEERVDVHVKLGWGYLQRGQLEIARQELERALELDSDHSRANHIMAILQIRLNNNAGADPYFARAVRNDPENIDARNDYGVYLCDVSRRDQGMQQFEDALASPLNRRREMTYLRAATCLMAGTDWTLAETYLRNALNIQPRFADALYLMAQLKYREQNYMSARAHLQRYFDSGALNSQSLFLAVQVERNLGARDLESSYAKQLRLQYPKSQEAKELDRAGGTTTQ